MIIITHIFSRFHTILTLFILKFVLIMYDFDMNNAFELTVRCLCEKCAQK